MGFPVFERHWAAPYLQQVYVYYLKTKFLYEGSPSTFASLFSTHCWSHISETSRQNVFEGYIQDMDLIKKVTLQSTAEKVRRKTLKCNEMRNHYSCRQVFIHCYSLTSWSITCIRSVAGGAGDQVSAQRVAPSSLSLSPTKIQPRTPVVVKEVPVATNVILTSHQMEEAAQRVSFPVPLCFV